MSCKRLVRRLVLLPTTLILALTGCDTLYDHLPPGTSPRDRGSFDEVALTHSPVLSISADPKTQAYLEQRKGQPPSGQEAAAVRAALAGQGGAGSGTRLYPRRGDMIGPAAARAPVEAKRGSGKFTLNFSDTDIREVIQAILGDILGANFIIDPAVQGTITSETHRPLKRDEVLPTLEALLAMQGVAIVRADGRYQVLPMAKAIRGNLVPRLPAGLRGGRGYSVLIVPLQFIAAAEMQKVLDPFLPEGASVMVDETRNLLLLAGTAAELGRLQETIEIFDVNWLQGMSVGMFQLRNVGIEEVTEELNAIIGEDSRGPMNGMFRIVPVERLNSILVITPQPAYLKEARLWIDRLDRTSNDRSNERRLHVYQVQNSTAEHLADLLGQLFPDGNEDQGRGAPPASLAPGTESGRIAVGAESAASGSEPAPTPALPAPRFDQDGAVSGQLEHPLHVVADTASNLVIVHATQRDYDKVERLLLQLDIIPRQVLVEATIAEISLSGKLKYGVQWFFDHSVGTDLTGSGGLGNTLSATIIETLSTGFTYAITNGADQIRLLLDALAEESRVRILSSPHLLVVDGQDASINVGDQVPISTGNTVTDGGTTVQRFELKDTGVLLELTPRINAGGMVLMKIRQEVTDPGAIDRATGQRSFLQRVVNSVVAIESGQTVVLGGLIRENKTITEAGIPILHQIPVVGNLFGTTEDALTRTELIILITPLIVRNQAEAVAVTQEITRKLKGLWKPRRSKQVATTSAAAPRAQAVPIEPWP